MNGRNFSYTFFERDEYLAKKDALGFTCEEFSTDGKYILVDKGTAEKCEDCNHDIVLPDWIPDTYPSIKYHYEDIIDENGEADEYGDKPILRSERVAVTTIKPLIDDAPHFNAEQACYIAQIKASAKGASDGYSFQEAI